MARPITARPDILVLGAGGTLGIAWLRGLLAGIEDTAGIDWRRCEHFVGTSAGSVVAASLAAGVRPASAETPPEAPDAAAAADDAGDGPFALPARPFARAARAASAWAGAVASPAVGPALKVAEPAGAVLRATALKAVPKPRRSIPGLARYVEGLGARFDGRLRVTAVDRRRGRRVVFGEPGAPRASVHDAVLASCAIPGVFLPVGIEGREYVDGGVWSPTNLDAAPAGRGSEVLCLMPTATPAAARSPVGALRAATHAAALAERAALRGKGARVRLIAPDAAAGGVMGADLMDGRRADAAYRAGFAQGRRLGGG